AGGVAVNINREFTVGKMAPGGFLDRVFKSGRPGGHALEKLRALLGRKRNQRAVIFALRSVLDDRVLVRRDAHFFGPERRARRAIAVFDVSRPIPITIAKIE